MGGTILAARAVYFAMRAAVGSDIRPSTQDLAGSVIFRVSALHGLILALAFAQEIFDDNALRGALVREATAVAGIWNDICRYDAPQTAQVQADLTAYARQVAGPEWRRLGEEARLSPEAWARWERVYQAVLDLVPETPREQALRAHMLEDVQAVAALRQQRENAALHALNDLFWIAAFAGVALVILPYFIFEPSRLNLALLSVYGGFTGLVMFIIYAFSDPFQPPGALPPEAFERLLETEIGAPRPD